MTASDGLRLLGDCADDGTGTTAIGIALGSVLLVGAGFAIWWLVNRRG